MFAIGEMKATVHFSKLEMPKEYHLRQKKLSAVWVGKNILYLSDELDVLKRKAAIDGGMLFVPSIDSLGRLEVPSGFNGRKVKIKGCISTIRVAFDSES